MSWLRLARKANKYAEAAVNHAIEEGADPKIQLEQAVAALQEHHRELSEAAARVIANENLEKGRLEALNAEEAKLSRSAQAALDRGDEAVARTFAGKLASVREQIRQKSASIPELEQGANEARQAVQESAEVLQSKINERSTILSEVDQTRIQQDVNASMKALSDLTGSDDVPSFEEIKDKVARQHAEAASRNEVATTDPAVLDMHAHHAEITAEADDILASLKAGSLKPAATDA